MIVAAGTQTRHSLQDVQAQADLITSTSVNVIQLELDPAIISYIAMTANHAGQRVIGKHPLLIKTTTLQNSRPARPSGCQF